MDEILTSRMGPVWLALCFIAVAASFLTSTIYSQQRAAVIDDSASAIADNAAPSIEYLAEARATLHPLLAATTTFVQSARVTTSDTAPIEEARQLMHDSLASYLAIPALDGEHDLRREIINQIDRVDRTVDEVLRAVNGHQLDEADKVLTRKLRPAVEGGRAAMVQILELKASKARSLARQIGQVRERSTVTAYALDAVSLALSGLALALAIMVFRRHTQLLAERALLMERRSDELEQFAGRVAHDVLGPLGPVGMFLGMVEPALEGNERLQASAQRARRGLQRVKSIVDGLLQFARAGARPAAGARTEVPEALAELRQELRTLADENGIELVLQPSASVAVACAHGVLISLLENLVRNAVKYMGEATTRRIEVRARPVGEKVLFEVEDTGPGIPRELRGRLFDPYVRGAGAELPGIGLGLATVKRLVEGHGGTVGVRAPDSGGSTFWFELPEAKAPAQGPNDSPSLPPSATA